MVNLKSSKIIAYSLLVLLAILIINSIYLFNFYIVKQGDLDIFRFEDYLFGFINSLLALLATLLAWRFSSNTKKGSLFRVFRAFVLALFFFSVFTSILFSAGRIYSGIYVDVDQLLGNILFSFSLSFLPITGLTLAILYFYSTQRLALETEKLQTQLLTKNLEPHFLFNNLSILSSLMRKRSPQAEVFLDNLSEVYRYFLKHNSNDSVSLQEEINFLKSYKKLIVERFGDIYQIKFAIEDSTGQIVPFALHTCLENAIKHNAAAEDQPLAINIERNGDWIYFTNTYRPQEGGISHGKGLKNITRRYELHFNKKIKEHLIDGTFKVEIPIIEENVVANK